MCPGADAVRPYTFSAAFPGARQIKPVGRQMLETKVNYCLGADHSRWQMGVPTFGVVVYEGLYDGIDLHTYGRRSNLKYEFHVEPGADWRQIRIRYTGIAGLSVANDGSLIISLGDGWGSLTDDAPVIYQKIAGKRIELPGRFVLVDKQTYTFEIDGAVDAGVPLVIDPELAWSTYLGGSGYDVSWGVDVDASGNVVVAGQTYSNGWVSGGFDTSFKGSYNDAFVAKLSHSGEHIWSTYLGGSGWDEAYSVAVDASGDVVATGTTDSSGWVSGGFDTSYNGGTDAFLVRLSSSGAHLWSTYLGGSGTQWGMGVDLDASGYAVVVGYSTSGNWVSGGFDVTYNGGTYDAFVARLSPSGVHTWSTYLGGSDSDYALGVAADASGNVLVTGGTCSSGWVSGSFDTIFNGGASDAFVVKLAPSGAHIWSAYLGGSSDDQGQGVAVDASGNVVVTGDTRSGGWVYGGFDTILSGNGDAFVAKLSPTGAHIWSTYLGGTINGSGRGVAVDAFGNVVVTGSASSNPLISSAFDKSFSGDFYDAFVAEISPTGSLLWSTYLGGNDRDWGYGVAVDPWGNVVVTGLTDSSGWVSGGFDTSHNGDTDAFVAKVAEYRVLTVDSTPTNGIQVTGDKPGSTPYTATCEAQQVVNLSAPNSVTVAASDFIFERWLLDGAPQPLHQTSLQITMDTDHTAVAAYNLLGDVNGDCSVNVLDLILTRDRLSQDPNSGGNWRYDVNQDTRINLLDLIHVRNQLRTSCP